MLQGPPPPLEGTRDPRSLGDPDSRFVTVRGIDLHYKEVVLERGGPPSTSSSSLLSDNGLQATSDDDPLVAVLLHGFNGSEFNFRRMLPALAERLAALADGPPAATGWEGSQQAAATDGVSGARGPASGPTSQSGMGSGAVPSAAPASHGGGRHRRPRHVRIIAYDRVPFGLSGRPAMRPGDAWSPYTSAGAANMCHELLQALGVTTPVVLLGHSAGAAVAAQVAAAHPDAVRALVLVSPAIASDPRGALAQADLGQLLRFAFVRGALLPSDAAGLRYARRIIGRSMERVRGGKGLDVHARNGEGGGGSDFSSQEMIDGYLRPLQAHDWDRGSLELSRALDIQSSLDWARVAAPVLVIHGREDRTVPREAGQRVVARFRQERGAGVPCEYVELPRCGHLPCEEQPSECVDAIVAFLAACQG